MEHGAAPRAGGLVWAGELPPGFEVKKLKFVADLYTGNSIRDDEKDRYTDSRDAVPYIATKDIDAVYMRADYENGLYVKKGDPDFKFAEKGSSLLCIEGGSAGRKKTFLDRQAAFVNKLCCVAPRGIDGKFLFYSLCTQGFEDEFERNMTGLIGGVSVSALKNIPIIVPPGTEQKRMAAFLDRSFEDIDAATASAGECILDYEKMRRAVITGAVTRGLRRPPLLSEADPWWGELPSHWRLRNLKDISTKSISYGVVKLFEPDAAGVRILRCSDVKEGYILRENMRTITKALSEEYKRTILKKGDVVVNVRGTLGGCAVIPEDLEGCNIAREVALISPYPGSYDSRYLMYCILSNAFLNYRDYHLAGSIYVGINMDMLSKFKCPVPPLDEQTEIADYLDSVCGEINGFIEQKKRIIGDLKTIKKSLIFEAITGRRRVG